MNNKKFNVHLVLEGDEEVCLFTIVKKFGVHESINLTFINAGGSGNVAPFYQSEINSESHDCNLCVYDVDYRQHEPKSQFALIQKQLVSILGEQEMANRVSFCSNPNILQIILLGCDSIDNVRLMSGSKKDNTEIVHRYWDKIGHQKHDKRGLLITDYYDAEAWQMKVIIDSFEYGPYTYETLFNNCSCLSKNYLSNEPGSNLFELLKALKRRKYRLF